MAQTSLILQIIALVINVSAILLLVIAAGLFGNAHQRLNENLKTRTDVCILYLSQNNPTPSNSICVFSIVAEVLAALGLAGLVGLTIVKLVAKLMKNKIMFIVEILFLLFSGVFALIAAVILSSGWGVTCDTIRDLGHQFGLNLDCNYDYLKQITASVVFAALAVAAIVGSSIFTIMTAVVGSRNEVTYEQAQTLTD